MEYAIGFTGDRHYRGGWTKAAIWQGPFPTRPEAEFFRPTARDVGAGDEVIIQRTTPRSGWQPAPGQTFRDTVDCPTGYDDCQECDGQGRRSHQVEVTVPAEDQQPGEADTLPQWLAQRFGKTPWLSMDEDTRNWWAHEAAAVRRAVARGGFKARAELSL